MRCIADDKIHNMNAKCQFRRATEEKERKWQPTRLDIVIDSCQTLMFNAVNQCGHP